LGGQSGGLSGVKKKTRGAKRTVNHGGGERDDAKEFRMGDQKQKLGVEAKI